LIYENNPLKGQDLKKLLENTKKAGVFSDICLFCTEIEAKFKKGSLIGPAAFDALSNKKKLLGFALCFG
jgi:hypothetical protein